MFNKCIYLELSCFIYCDNILCEILIPFAYKISKVIFAWIVKISERFE